jgi:hypothetical protein
MDRGGPTPRSIQFVYIPRVERTFFKLFDRSIRPDGLTGSYPMCNGRFGGFLQLIVYMRRNGTVSVGVGGICHNIICPARPMNCREAWKYSKIPSHAKVAQVNYTVIIDEQNCVNSKKNATTDSSKDRLGISRSFKV